MTDKPIIFSGSMVRAILEGNKTQTRRAIKPQPERTLYPDRHGRYRTCPFGTAGDRLWVRETWADPEGTGELILYRADMSDEDNVLEAAIRKNCPDLANTYPNGRWKPSIHMPRKFCRLLLDVKAVRVERLQDITENDAKSEGAERMHLNHLGQTFKTHRRGFESLWYSLNEKRGYGWDINPWVWVVEFKAQS